MTTPAPTDAIRPAAPDAAPLVLSTEDITPIMESYERDRGDDFCVRDSDDVDQLVTAAANEGVAGFETIGVWAITDADSDGIVIVHSLSPKVQLASHWQDARDFQGANGEGTRAVVRQVLNQVLNTVNGLRADHHAYTAEQAVARLEPLRTRAASWQAARQDLVALDGTVNAPSLSAWYANDDEAADIVHTLATLLTSPGGSKEPPWIGPHPDKGGERLYVVYDHSTDIPLTDPMGRADADAWFLDHVARHYPGWSSDLIPVRVEKYGPRLPGYRPASPHEPSGTEA